LETDIAHIPYFNFKIEGSSCIECSVKMVNAGRLDGFIFAQQETDPFLQKNKLKNISRQLFKLYDVKIVLPKGGDGGAVDTYLSEGISRLRLSGEYQKIMAPVIAEYDDWQP